MRSIAERHTLWIERYCRSNTAERRLPSVVPPVLGEGSRRGIHRFAAMDLFQSRACPAGAPRSSALLGIIDFPDDHIFNRNAGRDALRRDVSVRALHGRAPETRDRARAHPGFRHDPVSLCDGDDWRTDRRGVRVHLVLLACDLSVSTRSRRARPPPGCLPDGRCFATFRRF